MIAITPDPIDPAMFLQRPPSPPTGAIVTFVGTVRDDGIERMEIEAFEEMALADLQEIAKAAEDAHALTRVDVVHRIGAMAVGDVILVIVCGAGHRKEAFAGCEEILERIKERVPIWKKVFSEGEPSWV